MLLVGCAAVDVAPGVHCQSGCLLKCEHEFVGTANIFNRVTIRYYVTLESPGVSQKVSEKKPVARSRNAAERVVRTHYSKDASLLYGCFEHAHVVFPEASRIDGCGCDVSIGVSLICDEMFGTDDGLKVARVVALH